MSTISDKDLDKIFRDAAEKYKTTFDDNAWKAMEKKLDAGDSGFTYFKTIGGIIGIFLLGAFLIWWYTPEGDYNRSGVNALQSTKSATPTLKNPLSLNDNTKGVTKGVEITQQASPEDAANGPITTDKDTSSEDINTEVNNLSPDSDGDRAAASELPNQIKTVTVDKQNPVSFKERSGPEDEKHRQDIFQAQNQNSDLFFNTAYPVFLQRLGYIKLSQELASRELLKVEELNEDDEEKDRAGNIALKILYSPDLTSVGYFKPDRPGSNFGLVAEYFIANNWSIGTGAIYARKIYSNEEEQIGGYYSSTVTTSRIDGDCRVIDIPLNISYYIKRTDNQSIYLSAGSSSYLMLNEQYNYTTRSNGKEEVWSQEIKNQNNHFFGLLNLSIGYERRIKGNVYLQIEPFLKAPIAGIGEGKVDLVSTGAFLNLKYQFR